jgi:hypothetical protein
MRQKALAEPDRIAAAAEMDATDFMVERTVDLRWREKWWLSTLAIRVLVETR